MRVRGLWGVIGVALIVAGCGGSAAPPPHAGIHLDGKPAQVNYVLETDASGARFMVPAPIVAGQGGQAFQVSAPANVNVGQSATSGTVTPTTYRHGVADAEAVVPHAARVEILATGEPGRRFQLSWTETCGFTRDGKGAGGNVGGQGLATLRSPAVMLVRFPRVDRGGTSCYLAAGASTTAFTRGLHLMIIDY